MSPPGSSAGGSVVAVTRGVFAAASRQPPAATRRSAPRAAQQEEPDEGLGVHARVDGAVEVRERPADDLDALVLVRLWPLDLPQARGQVEVDLLVREAGARVVGRHVRPLVRRQAEFLRQLALRGVLGRLAVDVQAAGRDLEDVVAHDPLTRLTDEPQVFLVVRHDAHRAAVLDVLALDLLAVGVAEPRLHDVEDAALVDGPRVDALEARHVRSGPPLRTHRGARARRRACPPAPGPTRARRAGGCAPSRWRG